MENATLRHYRDICARLGMKPLASPEMVIDRPPGVVDVSRIYFPRKHLSALLELVSHHANLHTLILDEADLHTEDIEMLVGVLKGSHVSTLSLRNVKLHPQSGDYLKQLCRTNSRITALRLEGTMLHESQVESIGVMADLNRIASETAQLEAIPSLRQEAPKQPLRLLEGWANDINSTEIQRPTRCARDVVGEATRSVAQHYIDADFSFGQQLLGRDDIEYYRVVELADMLNVPSEECCVGSTPVEASDIYNNRELCAAINVLQQNAFLRNGVVCRSIPEFGLYGYRFFVNDEEVEMLVDDVIPCLVKGGVAVPIGIHSSKTDYWGTLVEKAFAKLVGGYVNIPSISFGEALAILTGGSCLRIEWMRSPKKKSEELFETLRDLSLRKITTVNCAIPETEQAKKVLERLGISVLAPYTVAQTATFHHKEGFTLKLVQLVAPTRGVKCTDCFSQGDFVEGDLLGFPTFWMEFEHFATVFETSCALIWSRHDPLTQYLESVTLPGVSTHSLFSCQFAANKAYLLRNASQREHEVRIVLRVTAQSSSDAAASCISGDTLPIQFVGYRASADGYKRYGVCDKNKLFASNPAAGSQQVFLFTMKPGEAVQLAVSSMGYVQFNVTVTSVGKFDFFALTERGHSYVSQGSWQAMRRNRRLPEKVFSFMNVSNDAVTELFVAVEQKKTDRPPFPISVVGWLNIAADKVTADLEPHFHTEVQRDYMSAWRISKTVLPGEEIVLLPCSFDDWCEPAFSFAVYSTQKLQPLHRDYVTKHVT